MLPLIIDCTRPNIAREGFIGIQQLQKNFKAYREMFLNISGKTGQRLKYGCESLTPETYYATMVASTTFYPLSSYFVTNDSSGNAAISSAGSAFISGHLICPAGSFGINGVTPTAAYYTCSATAGGESWPCIYGLDARFRIPVNTGTYARGNRGKLADLIVSTGVQGLAAQVSTYGHVQLLDGDETNNKWAIVRINPAVMSAGSAA
jgi:hypothetical protein